ncbi:MAG: protein kinase [Candidatus Eremiobacteraeota bacterium]|nr:protein kinase [Candidatus Eremiobacteraeota bacterium]
MLNPGETLHERYKVVRLIGKGGLSYVYEVEDLKLPTTWALKEFYPRNIDESEMEGVRAQFRGEVELLSRLHHQRLPSISDSFTSNGRDYMVLELIRGKTLDELLNERTEPFSEEQVREWTLQILEILEYLHGQSPPVIYRDIKPQNIIIVPDFGVRFIDFGIARLFNPVKEQDTIFMGTPGFSPPEQFRQRQTDFRSDIYSLGATMHYLLTLKDPGLNPFDFEPVSLTNPQVTPQMEKVVQKALEVKAENRFQTAADMRKVLKGELSFEELFRQSFLIIEPRELSFEDLPPGKAHTRELTIRDSEKKNVKANISAAHPGLVIKPPQMDAPSAKVSVTTVPGKFPRGERVVTSLTVSTEFSKITVPVSVAYRPTLIRGLSPAFASIIFFSLPVFAGLFWAHFLMAPGPELSFFYLFIIVAPALLFASFLPAPSVTRFSLLLFAVILALFHLLNYSLMALASPGMMNFREAPLSFALFTAFSVSLPAVLFVCAGALSRSQKGEMKLVILASFYLFPLFLFVARSVIGRSGSFVIDHSALFLTISAAAAIFFSTCFLYQAHREAGEGKAPPAPGRFEKLLRIATVGGTALIFAALWYLACIEYHMLSMSADFPYPQSLRLFSDFARYTVFLPVFPGGFPQSSSLSLIGIVALAFFVFSLFLPQIKVPVRGALFLLFAGFFLNSVACVDQMCRLSKGLFMQRLLSSPDKMMQYLVNADGAGIELESVRYYKMLTVAQKSARTGNYDSALNNYQSALFNLQKKDADPVTKGKLEFLIDQMRLRSLHSERERIHFDMFRDLTGGPLPEGFSPEKLSYFAVKAAFQEATPENTPLIVPESFFYFSMEGKCVPFSSDIEVLSALHYYRGLLLEWGGEVKKAENEFSIMHSILGKARQSEITAFLRQEWDMRKALFALSPPGKGPAAGYYHSLGSFYLRQEQPLFAMHYLLYLSEHFTLPLFEKGELVEALYTAGAREKADFLVESFRGAASEMTPGGNLEYAYLSSIMHYAKGEYRSALANLDMLKAERRFTGRQDYHDKVLRAALALRQWGRVKAILAEKMASHPDRVAMDDYLKLAYACDITGEIEKASPFYEKYLALAEKISPLPPRAVLARNRLEGGPFPSYIVMEQIDYHRNSLKYRVIIMGEGVPPECLPELTYYHGKNEKPAITVSDNISLVALRSFSNRNYTKHFNKVVFKDPENEKREKTWRFSIDYNFNRADFFPSEFGFSEKTIFNMKYVKDVPRGYRLPEAHRDKGIYVIERPGQALVVIPRFQFDPPYGDFKDMVQVYHNVTSEANFQELFPADLSGIFSVEGEEGGGPLPERSGE